MKLYHNIVVRGGRVIRIPSSLPECLVRFVIKDDKEDVVEDLKRQVRELTGQTEAEK